jgi:hypothetical protein
MSDHKHGQSLGKGWQQRSRSGQGEATKDIPTIVTRQLKGVALRAREYARLGVGLHMRPELNEPRKVLRLIARRRLLTRNKEARP